MTSYLRILLAAALAISVNFSMAGPAATDGAEVWRADFAEGSVTASSAAGDRGEARKIESGERLQAPFTVTTGADGQVTLSREGDRVSVGANARAKILTDRNSGAGVATRVQQRRGSVLYRVRHRHGDRFEVETPFLASVVKGTTFNVSTDESSSTVALMEGSVLVRSLDSGDTLLLQPGQAAVRSKADPHLRLHDGQSQAPVDGKVTLIRAGNGDSVVLRDRPEPSVRIAGNIQDAAAAIGSEDLVTPVFEAAAGLGGAVADVGSAAGGALGGGAADVASLGGAADSVAGVGADLGLGAPTAAVGDSLSGIVDLSVSVSVGGDLPDVLGTVEITATTIEGTTKTIEGVVKQGGVGVGGVELKL